MERLKIIAILALLTACSIAKRPGMEASDYDFEIDVQFDSSEHSLEPDVAKGKASGAARGIFGGMGACILGGMQLDLSGGGGGLPIGTALGILVSPVCGLVGGIYGGVAAESKPDVQQRIQKVLQMFENAGYPQAFEHELEVAIRDRLSPRGNQEGVVNNDLAVPVEEQANKPPAGNSAIPPVIEADAGSHSSLAKLHHVSSLEARQKASMVVKIRKFGFGEKWMIDEAFPFIAEVSVCVSDVSAGKEVLFIDKLSSSTAERTLQEWAELSQEELSNQLRLVLNELAYRIEYRTRSIKAGYKGECRG